MKLALIYWTYKNDAALLEQSLRAIQRLRKLRDDVELFVYAFDDGNAPLETIPEGVDFYQQTSWDRKGNLNGIENFYKMLETYLEVAKDDYDWIVKIDCDAYVNDWDWLNRLDPEEVVNVGTCNHKHYAHGCCYALSKKGLHAVDEIASRDDIRERIGKGLACEDIVFSTLAGMSGMRQHFFMMHRNVLGSGRGCYHDFQWDGAVPVPRVESPDPDLMKTHYAVVFKRNSYNRNKEEQAEDRADAIVRMTAYADWVEAKDAEALTEE